MNLDILGWFVGRVHTSQVDELATSSLGIRALSVAGFPRPHRVESVIGLVKAECIHTTVFHARVYRGLADIEWATAGWVDWYNNRRLHSSLDCLTPEEFEQALYAAIGREPQSAWERHRTCGASRHGSRAWLALGNNRYMRSALAPSRTSAGTQWWRACCRAASGDETYPGTRTPA